MHLLFSWFLPTTVINKLSTFKFPPTKLEIGLCEKRHVNLKKWLIQDKFSCLHESEFYHALKLSKWPCCVGTSSISNFKSKEIYNVYSNILVSSLSNSRWSRHVVKIAIFLMVISFYITTYVILAFYIFPITGGSSEYQRLVVL